MVAAVYKYTIENSLTNKREKNTHTRTNGMYLTNNIEYLNWWHVVKRNSVWLLCCILAWTISMNVLWVRWWHLTAKKNLLESTCSFPVIIWIWKSTYTVATSFEGYGASGNIALHAVTRSWRKVTRVHHWLEWSTGLYAFISYTLHRWPINVTARVFRCSVWILPQHSRLCFFVRRMPCL